MRTLLLLSLSVLFLGCSGSGGGKTKVNREEKKSDCNQLDINSALKAAIDSGKFDLAQAQDSSHLAAIECALNDGEMTYAIKKFDVVEILQLNDLVAKLDGGKMPRKPDSLAVKMLMSTMLALKDKYPNLSKPLANFQDEWADAELRRHWESLRQKPRGTMVLSTLVERLPEVLKNVKMTVEKEIPNLVAKLTSGRLSSEQILAEWQFADEKNLENSIKLVEEFEDLLRLADAYEREKFRNPIEIDGGLSELLTALKTEAAVLVKSGGTLKSAARLKSKVTEIQGEAGLIEMAFGNRSMLGRSFLIDENLFQRIDASTRELELVYFEVKDTDEKCLGQVCSELVQELIIWGEKCSSAM